MADNLHDVLHQMEQFGIHLQPKDGSLRLDTPKKVTCGKGGKFWYRLSTFRPDAGGQFIVGRYGSYKTGESEKVIVDWTPLKEAERERMAQERKAKAEADKRERERLQAEAAMSAAELWRHGSQSGRSAYLERKGVSGEACRYMPDGSILIPMIRYDKPRAESLQGVQRVWPNGRKIFTKDCAKAGCAVRLGDVDGCDSAQIIMLTEGFATGCTVRMATGHDYPVFVAMDAYNLGLVVDIVRARYPDRTMLICADDDWLTTEPPNPGRNFAKACAKRVPGCHYVYPIFPLDLVRSDKHTDFNDLHAVAGLDAVKRQVGNVLSMIGRLPNGR